ncbi:MULTISPECIES: hypothetical protein [unclassified Nocardioides]|uniref:hypothetical protein n=1 Tax=unclassified Nocardioides TaxID=2615069 RepID=UPI000ABB5E04|nr:MULTISPECIES: hypothetical protein [unclassified Nocardioides]
MDTNSIYYANAEIDYRNNRNRELWKPVRRRRKLRDADRIPSVRRPLDDDIAS